MIGPRILIAEEIVSTARPVSAQDVLMSDPRLMHLDGQTNVDVFTCWCAAVATPHMASFYLWPDGALGWAYGAPDDPNSCVAIVLAYTGARAALERIAIDSFSPDSKPN